jgi:nitrogenase subunit NifH
MPGLRKISRQVINTIRRSEQALTYKELSDLVTEKNFDQILDEVNMSAEKDMTFDSAVTKPKFSQDMQDLN